MARPGRGAAHPAAAPDRAPPERARAHLGRGPRGGRGAARVSIPGAARAPRRERAAGRPERAHRARDHGGPHTCAAQAQRRAAGARGAVRGPGEPGGQRVEPVDAGPEVPGRARRDGHPALGAREGRAPRRSPAGQRAEAPRVDDLSLPCQGAGSSGRLRIAGDVRASHRRYQRSRRLGCVGTLHLPLLLLPATDDQRSKASSAKSTNLTSAGSRLSCGPSGPSWRAGCTGAASEA